MKLTKVKPSAWNGVGFGTSSAVWAVKGAEEWRVSSQSGSWLAINQETAQGVWSLTRAGLLEKLNETIKGA